jgi:hypothetical protein
VIKIFLNVESCVSSPLHRNSYRPVVPTGMKNALGQCQGTYVERFFETGDKMHMNLGTG